MRTGSVYSDPDPENEEDRKRLAQKGLRKVWVDEKGFHGFKYVRIYPQQRTPQGTERVRPKEGYVKPDIKADKKHLEHVAREAEKQIAPSKERLALMKTSDPDYYAESLLCEIREMHQSIIECFRDTQKGSERTQQGIEDLKKHVKVIEKMMTEINKKVKNNAKRSK